MNPLEEKIHRLIADTGPITFRDFMEMALYDPEYGYYCRPEMDIGPKGDYYTAVNVHEIYSRTLAAEILRLWRSMNVPGPVTVVEMGPGTGRMAEDIARFFLAEGLEESEVRYVMVEKSASLAARQKRSLDDLSMFSWSSVEELRRQPLAAVVIQSEVVDAFPVHRLVVRDGDLREIYVDLEGDTLVDKPGALSDPGLENYWDKYAKSLPDGRQLEINLLALQWVDTLSELLSAGYVITVDYGMRARELYSDIRPEGTLVCYHGHRLVNNYYRDIGEQDITSHVNFSALIDRGESGGLRTISYDSQANFLINSGILDRLAEWERQAADEHEKFQARAAVKRLLFPQGMGEIFRVLVQKKRKGG